MRQRFLLSENQHFGNGYNKDDYLKAIKAYCFDNCQAGAGRGEVVNCKGDEPVYGVLQPCPVFPFRFGVNINYSTKERERRRQAAINRGAVGIIATQKLRHQTRFEAPELSEIDRGIVHPSSHGKSTKDTRKNTLCGDLGV